VGLFGWGGWGRPSSSRRTSGAAAAPAFPPAATNLPAAAGNEGGRTGGDGGLCFFGFVILLSSVETRERKGRFPPTESSVGQLVRKQVWGESEGGAEVGKIGAVRVWGRLGPSPDEVSAREGLERRCSAVQR
jgi:hypothetical protein